MDKPTLTSTNHLLPFGELSPAQFERLTLWLVEAEGYTQAQHLGAGGSEQGRDVTANRGAELWYFQCKRHKEISSAALIKEVEKYNELAASDASKKPHGVVFVTNAVLTAKTREDLEAFCQQHGYACEFWAQTELDMRVKKYDAIVKEFFNLPVSSANSSTSINLSGERNVYIHGDAKNVTIITGDGNGVSSASPQSAISNPQPEIKINLPSPLTPHLFGRDEELQMLDAAWANPTTNIVVFHALGGAGKSALVSKWLAQMAQRNYDGARRVFGWSFFSQGSSENRSDSSEAFIDSALAFFGVTVEGDYFRKADRLAEALRTERSILILDGVEPLQYPPNSAGLPEGGLKDRALQTILTQLAAHQPGLCVITSRERLSDLNGYDEATVIQRPLDHLPYETATDEQPCAQLLRALGAKGDDAEMLAAAQEFQGHAYGMTLLGSYVAEVLGGDLRRRKDIANLFDDDRFGSQADRMIAAYEKWLGDGVEVAILRLLGLFDRPAEAASIAALRAAPAIEGLTETLHGLSEVKWQQALSRLRRIYLLGSANESGELDAHPLVREHFRQRLKTNVPGAWRAGNLRLYEHLTGIAKDLPNTLSEMKPLFAAVAHGCEAGLHQVVFDEVYRRRIQRGNEYFSAKKLGAFSDDLPALICLTSKPKFIPDARLKDSDQAYLLHAVGFRLGALGRMSESIQTIQQGLELAINRRNWRNAATAAGNLSQIHLAVGNIQQASEIAQQSIELADHSLDWRQQMTGCTAWADVLHQSGKTQESALAFQKAEAIQVTHQPSNRFLYSLRGFQYCELLLGQGQIQTVLKRASQTVEAAIQNGLLLDIALGHLSFGKALMRLAKASSEDIFEQAESYLHHAIDGLREAAIQHMLPLGLLARAAWARVAQQYDQAHRDLAEARTIAERGEMRLHLTDYHLESARLALAELGRTGSVSDMSLGNAPIVEDEQAAGRSRSPLRPAELLDRARTHYEAARKLVDETGYHRRDGELRELEIQLG